MTTEKGSTVTSYPVETLGEDDDDGTMPANLAVLERAVVGHRIVNVERDVETADRWGYTNRATVIVLDNGRRVQLVDTDDCCAYTELQNFLLHVNRVSHVITGVGTTGGYTIWHIFADMGDVLELTVGWSSGNPFYYGYGFDISVAPIEESADADV